MYKLSSSPNERMIVLQNHSGTSTYSLRKLYAHSLAENNQIYFFDTLLSASAVLKRRTPHVFVFYLDVPDSVACRLIRFYRKKFPVVPIISIFNSRAEEASSILYSGANKILSSASLSAASFRQAISDALDKQPLPMYSRSEDLEAILHHQQEGILVVNSSDKVILFCNSSAAAMLGTEKELLPGIPCELFYKVGKQIECTIENLESSLHVQIAAKNILWRNNPAVLISMADMSRRKALEALLRKEKFVQTLQQLSGAIAHEFAQPLQVIKLIGEILRAEGVDPEYIKRLDSNCNVMYELVLNLRSIVDLQIQSYPGGEILDLQASATQTVPLNDY